MSAPAISASPGPSLTPSKALSPGRFLRDTALRLACGVTRQALRHAPGSQAKQRIWDGVVRPYLIWRTLEIEAKSAFGARFTGQFPDSIHGYMYFFGVWEPAITAFYRANLNPGDVVIDVGANVGVHSLLAASLVGATGRVHAVEASPWIHARLRHNIRTNGYTQVQTYNLAATHAPDLVRVFLHDLSNLGGTTIIPSEAERLGSPCEAEVQGLPLPQIIPMEELLAARLIKIDVEGAEWLVVQGMRSVLPQLRADCDILMELNPAALEALGGSLDSLLEIFGEAGFQPFEIANSYQVHDYITPPPATLTPFTRRDFDLADLVFRRP